jgi:hypothetical protein
VSRMALCMYTHRALAIPCTVHAVLSPFINLQYALSLSASERSTRREPPWSQQGALETCPDCSQRYPGALSLPGLQVANQILSARSICIASKSYTKVHGQPANGLNAQLTMCIQPDPRQSHAIRAPPMEKHPSSIPANQLQACFIQWKKSTKKLCHTLWHSIEPMKEGPHKTHTDYMPHNSVHGTCAVMCHTTRYRSA